IAVKLQRDAAAEVELEIQVTSRSVIYAPIETIIADQVRGAGRNAGSGETLAVPGRTASIAFGGCATTEDAADHCLIPPGCDVVERSRKTELARVVFNAAGELGVITEGDEWAMEKFCIHDGIAGAKVEERREISEGVIEMVRHIPSCVAGAEALLPVTRGSGNMQGRTEIQRRARELQPELREESTNATAATPTATLFLTLL